MIIFDKVKAGVLVALAAFMAFIAVYFRGKKAGVSEVKQEQDKAHSVALEKAADVKTDVEMEVKRLPIGSAGDRLRERWMRKSKGD